MSATLLSSIISNTYIYIPVYKYYIAYGNEVIMKILSLLAGTGDIFNDALSFSYTLSLSLYIYIYIQTYIHTYMFLCIRKLM